MADGGCARWCIGGWWIFRVTMMVATNKVRENKVGERLPGAGLVLELAMATQRRREHLTERRYRGLGLAPGPRRQPRFFI